jgi:hypothetical protein
LDFARYLQTGIFGPGDGSQYVDTPAGFPILTVAGSKDRMAPTDAVVSVCAASEENGKRDCIVFGKETGCQEDYGHLDLLLGERADVEVYPAIAKWLADHDGQSLLIHASHVPVKRESVPARP